MSEPWTNEHLSWLNHIDMKQTADGKNIDIYELNYDFENATILTNWAKHFRNHYCLDTLIDLYRDGTGLSRTEFLNNLKFPIQGRGSSTRSGDFGEILISDFLEYNMNFWVPRTRFSNRQNRNNPTQGLDVIGFKSDDYGRNNPNDELMIFEVKCGLTGNNSEVQIERMNMAINDSAKDFNVRKAESLNGLKQLFIDKSDTESAIKIQRFQNQKDNSYIERSGATSIISNESYDSNRITEINALHHPNYSNLKLILIKGQDLMALVHKLYEKAANEA